MVHALDLTATVIDSKIVYPEFSIGIEKNHEKYMAAYTVHRTKFAPRAFRV
jgi:hypothetical protein